MKDYKYLKRAKLFNPIFVVLYGITGYYLTELAQYGGIKRRVPIIIFLTAILLFWLIYNFYKTKTQAFTSIIYPDATAIERKITYSKSWFFIAIAALIITTGLTGYNIYQSAIPYNGKLSWYVDDFFNKKEVPFENNNIHQDGLNGMLSAIETEMNLPEELYLSSSFTISYNPGGEITGLYGFLYGQNEDGETESILITYNAKRSSSIQLDLGGYVEATYDKDDKFQPLIDGLNVVDLEKYDTLLNENEMEIYYEGFREISSALDLAYYYDDNDLVSFGAYDDLDYTGYSFTFQSKDFVTHYIYYEEAVIQSQIERREEQAAQDADPNFFNESEISEEYFLNDATGYQLVILDAALGSRFYGLRKTTDGGKTWGMHSYDPFLGEMGDSVGLAFIDERLGFSSLAKSGGSYANLYRTNDGGETFLPVEIVSHTVTQGGNEYEPFDYPGVPYKEDGQLFLEVSQGADGDYAHGVKALYVSHDLGDTFEFVKELKDSE